MLDTLDKLELRRRRELEIAQRSRYAGLVYLPLGLALVFLSRLGDEHAGLVELALAAFVFFAFLPD